MDDICRTYSSYVVMDEGERGCCEREQERRVASSYTGARCGVIEKKRETTELYRLSKACRSESRRWRYGEIGIFAGDSQAIDTLCSTEKKKKQFPHFFRENATRARPWR